MNSYPWMQFYVADWLSDPQLAMCSVSTRGIWIDALAAMQTQDRSGQLIGRIEQLARICRCTPAEMTAAISDLRDTGAAQTTECNGIVTLVSRRMKRDYDKRKSCSARVLKHRNGNATSGVPSDKHPSNAEVTEVYAGESDHTVQTEQKNKHPTSGSNAPTLVEVIESGRAIQCPVAECERFYFYYESTGWLASNGQPLRDWGQRLALWHADNKNTKPRKNSKPNGTHQGRNTKGDTNRNTGTANATSTSDYSNVGKSG